MLKVIPPFQHLLSLFEKAAIFDTTGKIIYGGKRTKPELNVVSQNKNHQQQQKQTPNLLFCVPQARAV